MKLAICSSAVFYPQVINVCDDIEKLGIDVILPRTAQRMRTSQGTKNTEAFTDWSANPLGFAGKAALIREHFDEIASADAILVMNFEKHHVANYIGPNVLMEMAIAFYLTKKIYVFNGIPADSPFKDEILAVNPTCLEGEISGLAA